MDELSREKLDSLVLNFHEELLGFIKSELPGFLDFYCHLKLDWSESRVYCRGGWYKRPAGPCVNHAMLPMFKRAKTGYYWEYASFRSSKTIGEFHTDKWELTVKAFHCHEVAHAMMGYLDRDNKELHGNRWKEAYTILRNKFVNPYLSKALPPVNSNKFVITSRPDKAEIDPRKYYDLNGPRNGLHSKHYGIHFKIKNSEYSISGWNPRARKNFVMLSRRHDNRGFVASPKLVIDSMKASGVY